MFSSLENVLNLTYYVRFIKNSLLKLPLKKGQFSWGEVKIFYRTKKFDRSGQNTKANRHYNAEKRVE